MSLVLSVHNIAKTYGAQTVLNDVSFLVNDGDHIGVVGANGTGKSTLLTLLVGRETADRGEISFSRSVEVGYLPQTLPDPLNSTIQDLILESVGRLKQLEARLRELEKAMAPKNPESWVSLLDEYGAVSGMYEARGGYDIDRRIDAILDGLNLAHLQRHREVRSLSGGERVRVQLAALLIQSPDLLLLDEPTNHLDNPSLEWLEGYLISHKGAVLAVSHDRRFLNRTVQSILEIDESTHKLKCYPGDYDAYATAKEAERARWAEDFARQQEEVKELRLFARSTAGQVAHNRTPRDGAKMAYDYHGGRVQRAVSGRTRAALERLRRIEENPVPRPPNPMNIVTTFDPGQRLESEVVLRAEGIVKVFGSRRVLNGVDLDVSSRSRMILTGPNGSGKTTLLKILMGMVAPDDGRVRSAGGIRFGYLPQEPATEDLDATVLDAYRIGMVGFEEDLIAGLLRHGLFVYDDLRKTVGQLSIGQRRKLEIARLMAVNPHILLLDEPTNHVSLDVLGAFEQAILDFAGPVLAVSHDRWFVERFGGEEWHLDAGKLTRRFPGTL